jgi:hypothetical protein
MAGDKPTTAKKPLHGSSVRTPEMMEKILAALRSGKNLSQIGKDPDFPHRDTIHDWLSKDTDFADKYARACEVRRVVRFETMEDTIDNEEDVARARLKIDVLKWQLSKEEPKKYGDKLDVTSDGEKLPTPLLTGLSIPSGDIKSDEETQE